MTAGLAFLATAIATLFTLSTLRRFTAGRELHQGAWTVALAMFTLASAALATGTSTGWDEATFKVFYGFGAVTNVPWLALGSVALLLGPRRARAVQWGVVLFTGFGLGAVFAAPVLVPIAGPPIPVGRDVFGALPRVLAAVGSGLGTAVIVTGTLASIARWARARDVPGAGRRLWANVLVTIGVLVTASGGIVQGRTDLGHDDAFTVSLVAGIAILYAGFLLASGVRAVGQPTRSSRRSTLPTSERGSSSTTSIEAGRL